MNEESPDLTSLRPYLLRAHHEWMTDNGLTPHLVVNARRQGVAVPEAFVKDGSIVLNVSLRAVRDLLLGNDEITFNARFSGVSHQIRVPMDAVRGLVAREYGVGLSFPDDEAGGDTSVDEQDDGDGEPTPPAGGPGGKRPSLRIVKS